MLAYKTHVNIQDDFIYLKIPQNFRGKKVEIIVLETEDFTADTSDIASGIESFYETLTIHEDLKTIESKEPNEFQKLLLSAPNWSDRHYNEFVENRKHFNRWTID